MNCSNKPSPLWVTLVIPVVVSLLVFCVTLGYWVYHHEREKAYQKRWVEYDLCGL